MYKPTSIRSIQTADRIYGTGDHPILVGCSDFNSYVCKYNRGAGSADKLFNEYLSASFLKLWELPVPDFAFVLVNHEHIPDSFALPKYCFENTCFGSRFDRDYQEMTHITENPTKSQLIKYNTHKNNFIRIALFDIWLGNEDRHDGNYNLLIETRSYNIIPIDHVSIFNSGIINQDIQLLTETDSIATSPFRKNLFHYSEFNKKYNDALKEYFYICTTKCKENYNEILENTPIDWRINKETIKSKLLTNIFNPEWEEKCLATLFDYVS